MHRPKLPVHQRFEAWDGVARGRVEDYDEENKYWQIRWETDKKVTDFDAEDMRKYCIERVDGKSEADGGHALQIGSFTEGAKPSNLLKRSPKRSR